MSVLFAWASVVLGGFLLDEDGMLVFPFTIRFGNVDGIAVKVLFCVEHCGCESSGRRNEALDLLWLPAAFFEPVGDGSHVRHLAARIGANYIWYNILLFAVLRTSGLKNIEKTLEFVKRRLPHELEDLVGAMFGGEFQMAADEIGDKPSGGFWLPQGGVMAESAGDGDVLDAWNGLKLLEHIDIGVQIQHEVGADLRREAACAMAVLIASLAC